MDDVEQDEVEQEEVKPTPNDEGGNDKWGGTKDENRNDDDNVDNDEATKKPEDDNQPDWTERDDTINWGEKTGRTRIEDGDYEKDKFAQVSMLQKVVSEIEEMKE